MRRAVSAIAAKGTVDVWQLEWAPYLATIDPAVPGPRVVMAHNVDTLIWQRYFENEGHLLKRAFLKTQWRKFRRFEERAFLQATRVVAVSNEDARLVRGQFGQPNVDIVDNGIDRAFFEHVAGRRDPTRILFLGALDWRPNLDAIGVLLDRIFPQVRGQDPRARLIIVGRNPPAGLIKRAAQAQGVELHTNVADVRVYLSECGVMAVPLKIGGGSRLKILEALASGLPVVSTGIGAEGLSLVAGQHYVEAENENMAQALLHAIHNPSDMQVMAERGRKLVLENYDWSALATKLEAAWEKACTPDRSARS
jgi:glycosyltransferase involved in cell wall biosynthesis